MTDRLTISLREPVQAHTAVGEAWLFAKAMLIAGHRMIVEIRPDTRSDAQNRLLHSRIGDIAKEAMDAWTGDFWAHRFGGHESVAEFMGRVAEVWDVCQPARATGQVQVWITHAGVARAVSLLAQGVRRIERADQWPSEAPAFGQCLRVLP